MQKFISGLILAAGTSSRMGQPKQLLPFRGTILLDWVMAQAESASALNEVIVVLGRAADEIQPRLRSTSRANSRTASSSSTSSTVPGAAVRASASTTLSSSGSGASVAGR